MSLFDEKDPQQVRFLARIKAPWTREKEAAFQQRMAEMRAKGVVK